MQIPVDHVKELERLIAAANCVRYFEIVKKPNKFQKFNSEFLSSCIENQFLRCLGRYPFGFLLFVFFVIGMIRQIVGPRHEGKP